MAFPNPPKTWAFQESVESSELNTELRDALLVTWHSLAFKSADETVNNSTTLQNDDHLSFSVGTTDVWALNICLVCTDSTGTTADIKVAFTLPASGVMALGGVHSNAAATIVLDRWITSGTAVDLSTTNTGANVYLISGTYAGGGTAGTFQTQWAQNTLTVTDTKVLKGSYIAGVKLA